MDSVSNARAEGKLAAYLTPMLVFVALLGIVTLLKMTGTSAGALRSPEYWVYPLQTVVCGGLLIWFWRRYDFGPVTGLPLVLLIAVGVFAIWIAPQSFGFAPRNEGFNPEVFAANPAAYWSTVLLRFLRLVVVVPLVEEIFWRGFLLRYFVNEKFDAVPFGTFSWLSFAVVTVGFTLAHSTADWPAAAVTGALYNLVAYRTRSLISCVLAHAITNLLLGLWIMTTKQWGFW